MGCLPTQSRSITEEYFAGRALLVVAFAVAIAALPVRAAGEIAGGGAVPDDRTWPQPPAGGYAGGGVARSPRPYPFFPLAANLWDDSLVHDFVDVDGPPALANGRVLDFDCSQYAYDGHTGQDGYIRTFDEQDIGVPAFAALDGIAIQIRDTEPDKNTSCEGLANFVVLDHGYDHRTRYLHFRQGAVDVAARQFVPAGQQIALTGSSGCSFWPHLHFESTLNRVPYEPSAGECRSGPSNWVNQVPIVRDAYLWDFSVSGEDLTQRPPLPTAMPRARALILGGTRVAFWILFANQPEFSTFRVRFVDPEGSERLDSGEQPFNNSFFRLSWWRFQYAADLDVAGTWEIRFDVNGERFIDAPFEVVASEEEILNRPPNAVERVWLDPAQPNEREAVFCRVETSLLFDDPEYDVVRFHYLWEVNGEVVRDVVHAGHADAIPWPLTSVGDVVRCTVTPSDGTDDGPSAQVETQVVDSFHCAGDCDELGSVTVDEIITLVAIALGNQFVTQCLAGEISGEGSITVDEIVGAVGGALEGCRPRPTPPTPTATENGPTRTPTPTPHPSITLTPSHTPIDCNFPVPQVEPLVSPTSNRIVTIRGTIVTTSDRQVHSVCQSGGPCFSSPFRGIPPNRTFADSFLLTEGVNRFEVCTLVPRDCNDDICTTTATDGSPLEVVYVPPTATPEAEPTPTAE